jgi:phosphatidylinositol glycan class P protein
MTVTQFNSTGVYAFVAWISSLIVFVIFIAWAFCPDEVMHKIGITYYPNRYYAIALPSYALVLYLVVGMLYIGINMISTLDPDDIHTSKDNQSRPAPNVFIKCGGKSGIPEIGDMDPADVSALLYRRDK